MALILFMIAATAAAGDKAALMARMGFSKEEIAKETAGNPTGDKGDPKAAAEVLKEAEEINKLRGSAQLRRQAENMAKDAEQRASNADGAADVAERKAGDARSALRTLIYNGGFSAGRPSADVIADVEQMESEARKARREAEKAESIAKEARQNADEICSRAKAKEDELEAKRLARVQSH